MMIQKNSYNKLTNRYDDVLTGRKWWSKLYMHGLWKIDDNAIAQEVLEMIPDDFDGKILDVPVGTAIFTYNKYARMHQAEIVGLDYSKEMIEIARLRFRESSIENIILTQGDVGRLPFPDDSFDCVLSMNGFHVFPDKEKAFAEVFRVLKPGGVFCGSFYIKGERKPADWVVRVILDKKGLFRAPHYTRKEAEDKLHSLFGENVEVKNEGSILIFKCQKRCGRSVE